MCLCASVRVCVRRIMCVWMCVCACVCVSFQATTCCGGTRARLGTQR
ncbi:MAG: hypothetical protein P4L40_05365 [Terracidiphilus sp.]|nr:hypothetical protein [Terracidiphilus sp.]